MNASTHPAGAVTALADGTLRQHGDVNPELNSSPAGESTDLQSGDLDRAAKRFVEDMVTDTATNVKADRADIGTE